MGVTVTRPQPDVDVTKAPHGARGDGTTDDTAAIRRAITAAGANGTVLFPGERTYLVSDQLAPLAGQTWRMDGATLTIPAESAGAFTVNDTYVQGASPLNQVSGVIVVNGVDRVAIVGATIAGNGDAQTGANIVKFAGILVHDAEHVVIDRCHVSDVIYDGQATVAATRQWGVLFSRAFHCEVRGGSYTHCGYECIGVRDGSRDVKIVGALCDDGATHAAQACCSPRTISGITRSSTTATVAMTGHGWATGDLVSIAGAGQVEYNVRRPITVVDANTFTYTISGAPATPATGTITAAQRPRNVTWDGCTFVMPAATSGDGLIFHDADACQAIGCGFVDAEFHDITSNDSWVEGCAFESQNRVIPLVDLDGANRPKLIGNTIQGNGATPNQSIVTVTAVQGLATHGLVFADNTVKNGSRGFQADPPAATDCLGWIIRDNTFDTVSTPIRLRGQVVRALIAGNTIRRTPSGSPTGNGIDIADTCTTCTLRDNDMTAIASAASRIVLAGSFPTTHVLRDNPGYATRATGATSVADGGTITHGLAATPTKARATASTAGEFASVTALGSTTITVSIKKHDGTAGTTQTVYYEAEV